MASLFIPSFAQGYALRDGPPAHPSLHQGLIGHWAPSLGKQGVNLADVSVNHKTGVLTDFANTNAAYVRGPPRVGARVLDYGDLYDNYYVTFGGDFPVPGDAISFAFWLYHTAHSNWAAPLSKGPDLVTGNHDWSVVFNAGSDNVYAIRNGANVVASTGVFTANAWTHFVCSMDANESHMWFNGVLESQGGIGAGNTTNTGGRPVQLMRVAAEAFGAVGGLMGDVAVWNRLLSPSEAQLLYERPNPLLELAPPSYPAAVAGGEETATLAVITATVAQNAVTATYESELSAGTAAVVSQVAQPTVTATYESELSASLSTVVAVAAQPSVSATYESELSASLSVVTAQVAQPSVTATYESELSASLSTVVAQVAQPAVTAVSGNTASLATVTASVAQPAVTATYESELTAGLAVLVASVAAPAVSPTWVLALSATLDTIVASVAQPAVTATTDAGGGMSPYYYMLNA